MTGELETLKRNWNGTKLLMEVMLTLINPVSDLVDGGAFFFTEPANGTAPSSLLVIALQQLVPIAEALQDTNTAAKYRSAADKISLAVKRQLWNEELGFYSLSTSDRGNFSAAGIAFAIRAGIANTAQAASSISKLPLLKYGVGYISDSTVVPLNETQLSPNILGFLLESLFIANTTMGIQTLTVAKDLLDNFWSKMVTQIKYFTGASWEYLFPDGSPGIGLFTSLSHPWGSAPTYLLPQYVLGVTATEPGYKTWQFKPMVFGLELDAVNGTVPTPHGPIFASWTVKEGRLEVFVEAPVGTSGVIKLPVSCSVGYSVGDGLVEGTDVSVKGGVALTIVAFL